MMRGGHWRKSTNDKEGSRNRNYDAAFRILLRMSKGLHKSKQNLILIFLFDPAAQNFKNHWHMDIKYRFNLIGLQKLFNW
jgi:hypothetical protein